MFGGISSEKFRTGQAAGRNVTTDGATAYDAFNAATGYANHVQRVQTFYAWGRTKQSARLNSVLQGRGADVIADAGRFLDAWPHRCTARRAASGERGGGVGGGGSNAVTPEELEI